MAAVSSAASAAASAGAGARPTAYKMAIRGLPPYFNATALKQLLRKHQLVRRPGRDRERDRQKEAELQSMRKTGYDMTGGTQAEMDLVVRLKAVEPRGAALNQLIARPVLAWDGLGSVGKKHQCVLFYIPLFTQGMSSQEL